MGYEEGLDNRSTVMPAMQETLFLPMIVKDVKVLSRVKGNTWRVDNRALKASSAGLGYRWSKRLNDTDSSRPDTERKTTGPAEWGSLLEGIDTGDGWLRVKYVRE